MNEDQLEKEMLARLAELRYPHCFGCRLDCSTVRSAIRDVR